MKKARMLFIITLVLCGGCARMEQQTRKPNFSVSFNISIESQIDPHTKAKSSFIVESTKAGK